MRLIDADALFAEIKERHAMFANCEYIGDKARRDELSAFMADIVNAPTVATDNNVPGKLKENEVHNYGKIITVYGHDDLDELEKTTIYRDICESLKDAGILTIHRTETPIGYKIGWKLIGVKKPNG